MGNSRDKGSAVGSWERGRGRRLETPKVRCRVRVGAGPLPPLHTPQGVASSG